MTKVLKNISNLPFERLNKDISNQLKSTDELILDFIEDNNLKRYADTFFAQGLAKFGSLPLRKNDVGYSAKYLFLDHIKPNPELLGLFFIFRYSSRSKIIEKQSSQDFLPYCSLVPLIMSAFKRYQGIGYNEWHKAEIAGITEPGLASVMNMPAEEYLEISSWPAPKLLELRHNCLVYKTGKKAGTARSAASTYTVYPPKDSETYYWHPLARIMLLQLWCAYPTLRNKYMVLDPTDWDNQPPPLLSTEIFTQEQNIVNNDLPW